MVPDSLCSKLSRLSLRDSLFETPTWFLTGTHECYPAPMKFLAWDEAQNATRRKGRGVVFEDAVIHIERGDVPDISSASTQTAIRTDGSCSSSRTGKSTLYRSLRTTTASA